MLGLFRWIIIGGTVTSTIYSGMVCVAAMKFGRRRNRELREAKRFMPSVSVLKPLHGWEDGLEENLRGFFQQNYQAPYELLFCARHEDDTGLKLARAVASEYPDVPARFLICGEPQYPNAKVYSLAVMIEAAKYDYLITSDADSRVNSNYLLECIQSLRDPTVALAFCMYVGHSVTGSLYTRLDAVGKTVEMGSGVLVAEMLSGADFALGVTMVVRREAFDEAGGTKSLGEFYAEDFVIGNRLHALGRGVCISPHVIRLSVPDQGLWKSFRDQLRWMQSTRRSRPWGHLGTGLTFAMPFGVLGFLGGLALAQWVFASALLTIAVLGRVVQAIAVLHALGANQMLRQALLFPLRDLLGSIIWVASYLPADTRYHGTKFRILSDGRLQRPLN